MRKTSRIYPGALAVITIAALNLALGVSSALAAGGTTAGTGAGATGAAGGGADLTSLANSLGTTVHTLAYILVGIAMAIAGVIAAGLHKWKTLIVELLIGIGACFMINGGALNIANNQAGHLSGVSAAQSQAAAPSGIPGVTGP